jgi:hypothetical protein
MTGAGNLQTVRYSNGGDQPLPVRLAPPRPTFAQNYVVRNTKSLAELGGTGDFIPDVTTKIVHEVKNAGRLQMDSQLAALARFCRETGRKFVVHVRPGWKIDSTVVQGIERDFVTASRDGRWETVTDIPDTMSVSAQMAK